MFSRYNFPNHSHPRSPHSDVLSYTPHVLSRLARYHLVLPARSGKPSVMHIHRHRKAFPLASMGDAIQRLGTVIGFAVLVMIQSIRQTKWKVKGSSTIAILRATPQKQLNAPSSIDRSDLFSCLSHFCPNHCRLARGNICQWNKALSQIVG